MSRQRSFFVFALALGGVIAARGADAQTAFSVSASVGDFHVAVSNYYHVPEREVIVVRERRIPDEELPVVFFIVAVSLFPLGVGPEPQTLRVIAAGVVWVCALLASMLSVSNLYALDHADGSLEQMLLSGHPATMMATAKAAAHWTITGAPLVLAAPVIGLLLDMSPKGLVVLVGTLLLGTPILSLLGAVGAALFALEKLDQSFESGIWRGDHAVSGGH